MCHRSILLHYAYLGEVQWTSPLEAADSTQGWGIFVDQSGAIYMTGSIVPPLANEEILYARFSNAGALQWQESRN